MRLTESNMPGLLGSSAKTLETNHHSVSSLITGWPSSLLNEVCGALSLINCRRNSLVRYAWPYAPKFINGLPFEKVQIKKWEAELRAGQGVDSSF